MVQIKLHAAAQNTLKTTGQHTGTVSQAEAILLQAFAILFKLTSNRCSQSTMKPAD